MPVRLQSIETYIVSRHGSFRHLELSELQVLDRWAGDIVAEIEDAWPVDTSTSRDAFMYTIMSGGEVGFTIQNDVDYVEYITFAGDATVRDGGSPLIDTLIPNIVHASAPQLLQDLRTAVDAAELTLVPVAPRRPRGSR